ncbi:MAG: DUF3849 domain-containing protein [Eubacteriales bacterium]
MKSIPIIYGSMDVAMENGTAPELFDSIDCNIACRDLFEEKLEDRKQPVLTLLIDKFGTDRVRIILATSVQAGEQSEEVSDNNKDWAFRINVPEEQWQDYMLTDYVALEKLVTQFRFLEEQNTTTAPSKESIKESTKETEQGEKKVTLVQRLNEAKEKIAPVNREVDD